MNMFAKCIAPPEKKNRCARSCVPARASFELGPAHCFCFFGLPGPAS